MAWIFLRTSSPITRYIFQNGLNLSANILINYTVHFPEWLGCFCEHPHQLYGTFSEMAWIFLQTSSSVTLYIFQNGLDLSANILFHCTVHFPKWFRLFLRTSSPVTRYRYIFQNGLDLSANILISYTVHFPNWLGSICEHPFPLHGLFSKRVWIFLRTSSPVTHAFFNKAWIFLGTSFSITRFIFQMRTS